MTERAVEACPHFDIERHGTDTDGTALYRCNSCGDVWNTGEVEDEDGA